MAFTFQMAYAANVCTVYVQLYDCSMVCISELRLRVCCVPTHQSAC